MHRIRGKKVADGTTLLGANLRQISAHGHCVGAKWGLLGANFDFWALI